MPNWKSPGPDSVQRFWLKNFSSFHGRVISPLKEFLDSGHGRARSQPKECLDSGFMSSWLTKGTSALL